MVGSRVDRNPRRGINPIRPLDLLRYRPRTSTGLDWEASPGSLRSTATLLSVAVFKSLSRGLKLPIGSRPLIYCSWAGRAQPITLTVNRIECVRNPAALPGKRCRTSAFGRSASRQMRQVLKSLENGIQNRSSQDVFHTHQLTRHLCGLFQLICCPSTIP